ncbi:cobalamin-dependent protein [Deltaproteobacteria bacterium OttesenSCG-928-K17]|nr:cobalamin-dependent protein [Deltaproteobacteria bacterium OttesenSCG-928-K17]
MDNALTLDQLAQALVGLEDVAAVELTQSLLETGIEPVEILTACEQALTAIGEKYAAGEYFISGLIMAGDIMSRITEIITPRLSSPQARIMRGRVLVGTVEGDIHDLGKNIAGALLSAHGFEVRDLGVDVPADDFVRACRDFNPDIVGLSALLTSCFPALQQTVARLKDMRGESGAPAIFISGFLVTEDHCRLYGADHLADTAFDTIRLCERIMTGDEEGCR